MTEKFSIFGFQRASCRERNPTSEKRNPVQDKSIPKPKEEMQPKSMKKDEIEYRHESNDYVIFGIFSLFLFCYAEQNTTLIIEYISSIELKIWTGYFVMQKKSFNTEKTYTRFI